MVALPKPLNNNQWVYNYILDRSRFLLHENRDLEWEHGGVRKMKNISGKIKKICVVVAGLVLAGSTVFGATMNLGAYPSPFIKDGKFSGMLVVGDKAAAEDVIGVSNIAMSLQYAATSKLGNVTTETVVEGDAWMVGTSSKKLEITQNIDANANFGEENIRNITNSVDKDELESLKDGSITTQKGTAHYSQYINFDDSIRNGGYVKFMENEDDVAADFLYFGSGAQIARYSLEFKTSLQSDVEDADGDKNTDGLYFGDIKNEKINVLGKDYVIVNAKRIDSTTHEDSAELTLMGGSIQDTISEGETKTYTINGKEYEVQAMTITDQIPYVVKFKVNEETTKSLKVGDSISLSDDTEIGVSEIISNEAGDPTADMAEFYLGASKVYLKDDDITDDISSNELEIDNNRIDDTMVIITGNNDDSTVSIDSIQLDITAGDEYFINAGHKLSEYVEDSQALLGLDIKYEGLDQNVETEAYKLKASGSDKYTFEFVDGDGNNAKIPLAYTSGGTNLGLGNDDNALVLDETKVIQKNDYLIVTNGDKTYALRYKGATKADNGETPTVKFDNVGTGSRIEQTLTDTATLKLGGASFSVINASPTNSDDFDVQVDLNDDNDFTDTTLVDITTKAGLQVNIDDTTADELLLTFSTPDGSDYDNVQPADVALLVTASGGEVQFTEPFNNTIDWMSPSDEEHTSYVYTSMGAKFKWDSSSNDPDELTIEYPKEQKLPVAYVTIGTTKTVPASTETIESVTINKIDVGATKLASEITDARSQNLLLVGGPCANTLVAELKNNPADCTAGYEAGKGLIELIDTGNGNFALIVAGYSAVDTRTATTVLANYGDYILSGDKMEVITATKTVKKVTETAPVITNTTTE